jgi:hypothetical protein
MFDALLSLLAPSVEMPLGVDPNNDFTPFDAAFAVEVPYGLRDGAVGNEMESSHALTLSVEDADPAARLHAVVKGRLRFVAADGTEPARLELRPLPIHLFLLRRNFHLSPLFKQVLYGNVEPSSVEAAAVALLTDRGVGADKVTEQVGEFMAGSRQFTVAPGDFIGRPTQDVSLGGRRRLELMFKDRDEFYLNPAHFLFQWPAINDALENHPLLQTLEPAQHRMLFASKTRLLYVSKNNLAPQPPYNAEQKAALSIQDALAVAVSGDTIIVQDNETYGEQIMMKNGVKLTSKSAGTAAGRVALNASLPTIECPVDGPAVTFKNLLIDSHISGFIITHAAGKTGSGVLIDFCKRVEVANNKITGNEAQQGGGVAVTNSSSTVFIKQNVISGNEANDGPPGSTLRAQGGGIYINRSRDVTVENNALFGNTADNFGAGIAIVDAQLVSVLGNNDIGIGAPEYSAEIGNLVAKESHTDWVEYSNNENPQGGGGGIGITKGVSVTIKGNNIRNNNASRGGGIEVFSLNQRVLLIANKIYKNEARKLLASADLGGDGGGVAVNFVSTDLATARLHRALTLIDNDIHDNTAADDGGGVYGTGKAILLIQGVNHKIWNNTAQLNGGGVRATFGSAVTIKDGEISGNKANQNADSATTPGGGGGVSFSNSSASITGCTIKNNEVENFGGGGVYFATPEYEASLLAVLGKSFTQIVEDAYEFTKGKLRLDNCAITGNKALKGRGAGGGLYVVYDDYPIHLTVQDTTFNANVAEHTNFSKKLTVVIQSAPDKHTIINDNNPELQPLSPLNYEQTFTNDD